MLLNILGGLIRDLAGTRGGTLPLQPAPDWIDRGITYWQQGLLSEAENCFRQALKQKPDNGDAQHLLGATLLRQGNLSNALTELERAARLTPTSPEVHVHLGDAFLAAKRPQDAMPHFKSALECRPGWAPAHNGIGNAAKMTGQLDVAIGAFRDALRSDSSRMEARHNLGEALAARGDLVDAAHEFESVLSVSSGSVEARFSLALVRLASGEFNTGWQYYEARFDRASAKISPHTARIPRWTGEDLSHHSILIWGEQGLGDEILFAGMYPEMISRTGGCVIECSPKLLPLFMRSFDGAQFVGRSDPTEERCERNVNFQIAAGSLGAHLRSNLDSFPTRTRYLMADENRAGYWRERLQKLGPGLKIGFSWRSIDTSGVRALDCTRLEQWGELFAVQGVHWVCLQYDACDQELALARERFGVPLHRFESVNYFDDLDELSALITGLDLVITAPTVVCRHAAALGVEVWQLVYGLEWQTHGTQGNPWLPTTVRFPRRWNESWVTILGRAAQRLRERLGGHSTDLRLLDCSTAGTFQSASLDDVLSAFHDNALDEAGEKVNLVLMSNRQDADAWLIKALIEQRLGRPQRAYECITASHLSMAWRVLRASRTSPLMTCMDSSARESICSSQPRMPKEL